MWKLLPHCRFSQGRLMNGPRPPRSRRKLINYSAGLRPPHKSEEVGSDLERVLIEPYRFRCRPAPQMANIKIRTKSSQESGYIFAGVVTQTNLFLTGFLTYILSPSASRARNQTLSLTLSPTLRRCLGRSLKGVLKGVLKQIVRDMLKRVSVLNSAWWWP